CKQFDFFIEKRYEDIFDKKYLRGKINDINPEILNKFVDEYKVHLNETRGDKYLAIKSFDESIEVLRDEKCKASFLFSKFLGKLIFHSEATVMLDILNYTENTLIQSLEISSPSIKLSAKKIKITSEYLPINKQYHHETFDKLLSYSEELIRDKINLFLQQKEIIMLDKGVVTVCTQEVKEEIILSSMTYMRTKLTSYINEEKSS
ncbi:hypothetical protein, partial [Candidatus Ichthyocystis sparus]|uniref:hypothetical protein n=1 Tax=Candidatus Ichthyocystis sparus TaxID=1561004 RepID=UPI00159EE344